MGELYTCKDVAERYEVWSKQLVEIGKLLGSWLNTVKANSKT